MAGRGREEERGEASSAGVYPSPSQRRAALEARLRDGPWLLLDGATGTELERRGIATTLPLWSTPALLEAPSTVEAIHADYASAGADVVTANTFRTQRRVLEASGAGENADALTDRAVALARAGARGADPAAFVVGSAPPLEDCYRPDLAPPDDALTREHAEHARALDLAGVDAVWAETHNTGREAVAATRAAADRGLPTVTSFVCWDGPRLLDGTPLRDAARRALDAGAAGVGVNCLPPSNVLACLEVLGAIGAPFGVYANLGEPEDEQGFARSEDCAPREFAGLAAGWLDAGARWIGGCCGTTPAHLRAMAERLRGPKR